MVKGIVIPAVPFLPLEEREFLGLQDYQDAVGGYIEPIAVADPALTIYVNEDSKSRRMSLNGRATALWWLFVPQARGCDLIVGVVVVLPDDPDSGASLLTQLQRQRGFRVEVQVVEPAGEWITGPREFGTWFEAAKFALLLEQQVEFIVAVRVASE